MGEQRTKVFQGTPAREGNSLEQRTGNPQFETFEVFQNVFQNLSSGVNCGRESRECHEGAAPAATAGKSHDGGMYNASRVDNRDKLR
ncbi:MAG: hypothetical protein ACYTGB_16030 [Planctomycetota bacterium]|jgi:hypothetical protein